MFLRFLPALLTLLAAAGATAAPAKLHADHPLSYTLWDTRADRPIDEAELFARAIAARWVLVGEKRSEEHTSELQSLMRISYAVFCLKKKKHKLRMKTHRTKK